MINLFKAIELETKSLLENKETDLEKIINVVYKPPHYMKIHNLIEMLNKYNICFNIEQIKKNTLGEYSKIEYYYKQPTEFIGLPMRKKTATLMRNIRILNDLNKLIKTPKNNLSNNCFFI